MGRSIDNAALPRRDYSTFCHCTKHPGICFVDRVWIFGGSSLKQKDNHFLLSHRGNEDSHDIYLDSRWIHLSETYSEPCQTSEMEHCAKLDNDF